MKTSAIHPGQALLDEQQQLNRWDRQIYLHERAQALVLGKELRAIRTARKARENVQ